MMRNPIRSAAPLMAAAAILLTASIASADGRAGIQANRLLVAIEDGGAVMIDPRAGQAIARYATGPNAFGAVFSLDGSRAFVTDKSAGTLSEIDPRSAEVLITIPVGNAPHQPAIAPDGRMFIPLNGGSAIAVVDVLGAPRLLRTIPIGNGTKPHIVAISPDGRTLWATVQGMDPKVISFELNGGAESLATEVRYDLVPRVVAASNGGAFFTAHHSTGLHYVANGATTATTPYLDVNGPSSEPRKQIEGVATNADGSMVVVTHEGRRALVAIRVAEDGAMRRFRNVDGLSHNPYWASLDPSGKVAYVSIPGSGTVEAYDLTAAADAPAIWSAQIGGKPKRMAVTR